MVQFKHLTPATPASTQRTYLIITALNLVHVTVLNVLFAFGLMRIHAGIFAVRNDVEAFVTQEHERMVLSAMPEFIFFPPWFIGWSLTYFYTFVLYHGWVMERSLLTVQRRYTRYSLVTPVPHAIFVAFFTLDGLVIYFAARKGFIRHDELDFAISLGVGSCLNVLWVVVMAIFYPPFLRYRKDMVDAEKELLQQSQPENREDVLGFYKKKKDSKDAKPPSSSDKTS